VQGISKLFLVVVFAPAQRGHPTFGSISVAWRVSFSVIRVCLSSRKALIFHDGSDNQYCNYDCDFNGSG
jgi:hypothetical protein